MPSDSRFCQVNKYFSQFEIRVRHPGKRQEHVLPARTLVLCLHSSGIRGNSGTRLSPTELLISTHFAGPSEEHQSLILLVLAFSTSQSNRHSSGVGSREEDMVPSGESEKSQIPRGLSSS